MVTQFGRVIESKDMPGEYFKIPVIQKAHFFTKKIFLTEWEQQIPTIDGKLLSLKTKAFWKITDPVQYYENINSYQLSELFVRDRVGAVEREFIIAHPLSGLVQKISETELENVECNPRVTMFFMAAAKDLILKVGISINNIEAWITTSVNMMKP